jgi:hypothetical protein
MAEPQPTNLVPYEGKLVPYSRAKYLETLKQEAVLRQVNTIITDTASKAVSAGATLGQQDFGGLLRTIVPQLLDQYGSVNATAAVNFYDNARLLYTQTYGAQALSQVSRSSARARANRYATAVTKSAVSLGQMSFEDFQAKYADDYKTAEKSERVIGYAMKVRAQSGHDPSVEAMNKALTREVASYHHDTILFNSALDPSVSRVQRVAQASACEFCRLMALGSTNGQVRVSTYAAKFHDNCHCTIQPLYEGEEPIRPPYYDDFEKEYTDATREVGSSDTKDVLKHMRNRTAKAGLPNKIEATDAPSFREVDWNDLPDVDMGDKSLVKALGDYQTDNYPIINNYFRNEAYAASTPEEFIDAAKKLNDGLYKTQLQEDVILYRHQGWDLKLDKLQEGQDFTGTLWNSKSPLSTYVPTAGGQRFGISDYEGMPIQWKIRAPKGTYGARMVNNVAEENEFVLAPNTDLLISKVEKQGDRYIVEAVVTGQKKVDI